MKMVMAVIPRDQAGRVLEALVTAGFAATFLESRGGMLRQAQHTLFLALEKKDLDRVLDIIRENCRSQVLVESDAGSTLSSANLVRAELGGAVVFAWDLDRFEIYGSTDPPGS